MEERYRRGRTRQKEHLDRERKWNKKEEEAVAE